jgi:hypothetical protein
VISGPSSLAALVRAADGTPWPRLALCRLFLSRQQHPHGHDSHIVQPSAAPQPGGSEPDPSRTALATTGPPQVAAYAESCGARTLGSLRSSLQAQCKAFLDSQHGRCTMQLQHLLEVSPRLRPRSPQPHFFSWCSPLFSPGMQE